LLQKSAMRGVARMNEMRLSVDVTFEDIEAFSKWLQLRSRRVSDAILVLLVSIAT
jgi:hypothetical protein